MALLDARSAPRNGEVSLTGDTGNGKKIATGAAKSLKETTLIWAKGSSQYPNPLPVATRAEC
ncbi:hypothetical protein NCCP2145_41850 [Pseudarthrobacter sp. NCCP-2145]|nr:hypothetical protein NCCP2145_41850 [Pseudarthrobacter sp. NCCP-2145]